MSQHEAYVLFYRLLRQGALADTLAPLAGGDVTLIAGLYHAHASLTQRNTPDPLDKPFYRRQALETTVNRVVVERKRYRRNPFGNLAYAA